MMRFFLMLLLCLVGCAGEPGSSPDRVESKPEEGARMERPPIDEVLARHDDLLLALEGVHGIYVGLGEDGAPCIKLMVSELDDEARALLPGELEGWTVEIVDGGPIRPME